MGLVWTRSCLLLCLIVSLSQVSGCQGSASMRKLFQVKNICPIDFGSVNYTSITSVCQPPYLVDPCCNSFIALACRYITYINDLNTTCADEMFAYLNNAGNYSGGLFANLCVQGPQGLLCPAAPAPLPSSALVQIHRSKRQFIFLAINLLYYVFIV